MIRKLFGIKHYYTHGVRSYKYTHWIARHLPHRLIYWSTITLMARVTTGDNPIREPVPDIKAMDAIKKYEKEHKL